MILVECPACHEDYPEAEGKDFKGSDVCPSCYKELRDAMVGPNPREKQRKWEKNMEERRARRRNFERMVL